MSYADQLLSLTTKQLLYDMQSVLVTLSLLSLLVVCDAWFLNLKSDKKDKLGQVTPAQNTRKVILVARKVYVPMYASDDTATPDMSGRLLPVSPVLATSGAVMGGQQPLDSSSMYYQPPVVAYAMSGPASGDVPAAYTAPSAYAAPVPVPSNADAAMQPYAFYTGAYGVAGPQYDWYGSAAPVPETWVMQYPGGDAVPAAPYPPTGTDGDAVTQEVSASAQTSEAYPSV
ncbi:hypothetical protein GHT06_011181 [Daphnia sinensis]|uniref:Uncharacterized protein n=1 Tax=Daphnia sinensis TaxID=1820382 RepID=A0AAD5PY35_9CRUS|nr:hypothetical protein GHT06_011181 [Daphnia sinensis]